MRIRIIKQTVSFLIIALLVFTQAGILSLAEDNGNGTAGAVKPEIGEQNKTDEPNGDGSNRLDEESTINESPESGKGDTYEAEPKQANAGIVLFGLPQSGFAIIDPVSPIIYGDVAFPLGLTGDEGTGAVTFERISGDAVTVTQAGVVTIVGTGSVTIKATKAADETYDAAEDTVTFTVAAKEIDIKSGGSVAAKNYNGSTAATVTGITFDKLATGETLIKGEDYTVSAEFVSADAGENKDVTVTVTLEQNGPKSKNYTFADGGEIQFTLKGAIKTAAINSSTLALGVPVTGVTPQDATTLDTAYTVASTVWSGKLIDGKFTSGTVYSATIKLTAGSNRKFVAGFAPKINGGAVSNVTVLSGGGEVQFKVTFSATPGKAVTAIAVDTQPKLEYAAGDKLNFSALKVNVTYADATSNVIAYASLNGATYEIDGRAVTSSDTLYAADNDKPITITYGGQSVNTSNLAVYTPPQLQIFVSGITSTSAIITYDGTGVNPLTLTLQVKNGNAWKDVAGVNSPYTATGLKANTDYEYRVLAMEGVTNREYTALVKFKTVAANASGITVTGKVVDASSSDIQVTLKRGNTVIDSVKKNTPDSANTYNFSFAKVPNGVYSITADNGASTVTQAVTVANGKVTSPTGGIIINMPDVNMQSAVESGSSAPNIAVDGLSDLFDEAAGILDEADLDAITHPNNGAVKITLEAGVKTPSTADKSKIGSISSGQTIGMYLDLSVVKSRFDDLNVLLERKELSTLGDNSITITFELPDDLKNRKNLTVYRVHAGNAEKLPKGKEKVNISGNIIKLTVSSFSTYAIGYTPSSSSGSGGSSSYGYYREYDTTYWIGTAEARDMAKTAWNTGSGYARSYGYDVTGIRDSALRELDGLSYRHDTTDGNSVQVRLYIGEPEYADKDILVSGYVTGDEVSTAKSIFKKWYDNNFAVVSMDQQGSFGMTVQIAAKANLSGMNTDNLYFYSYDRKKNLYTEIKTGYRIDSNGYLHFATMLGGDIIISDAPLGDSQDDWLDGPPQDDGWLDGPGNQSGYEPPSLIDSFNPEMGGDPMIYQPKPDDSAPVTPLVLEAIDSPAIVESLGAVSADPAIPPAASPLLSLLETRKDLIVMGIAGIIMLLLAGAMKLWSNAKREDIY